MDQYRAIIWKKEQYETKYLRETINLGHLITMDSSVLADIVRNLTKINVENIYL